MGVLLYESRAKGSIDEAINNESIVDFAIREVTSFEYIMEYAIVKCPTSKSIATWRQVGNEHREKLAMKMFVVATYVQNFKFVRHLQETQAVSVIDVLFHVIENIPDEHSYIFWKMVRGNPGKHVAKELFRDACMNNKAIFAYLIHQRWGPWKNKQNIKLHHESHGVKIWGMMGFYGMLYWHAHQNGYKKTCQVLEMISRAEESMRDVFKLRIVLRNIPK